MYFRNTRFNVGHVLLEGTSSMRSGSIGWYVMQVDMYAGRHVVVVVLSFMRIPVVGGHS